MYFCLLMRKFLIPVLAALALPAGAIAGIPESKSPDKWVRINENWIIDTEDVEVKSGKLRFYMQRTATKDEFEGPSQYIASYIGKVRIKCDKFQVGIQVKLNSGLGSYYGPPNYEAITKNNIGYPLANYFCFATGEEGYTRELNEPDWVVKIIDNIKIQKIKKKNKAGNVNCDSPVWKSKPRCN